MRNVISVLDQTTIDKIAAGEVVERPASVVKELVENSIDAGASAITVEIKEGGISLIRITDNGMGIEKKQVPLAFLRHATSKIRQVEDLTTISSLGFRGEALSSIAAVAQVELITKPHDQLIGVRYCIEGGVEKECEEIGAPDGTTFLVHNLFYNTPARAKFLKSPAAEAGYISSFIEQLALSHPHISFKFMQNGQTKLHTSGNNNLKEVIYQIYGRDITRELISVDYKNSEDSIHITGFIGRPSVSRGNRNFENYYVNGRYIKSKVIIKAIEDGYHAYLMQHQYPFTNLNIELRGDEVDINVHPTKMEVRFSNQELIYQAVYGMITETLSGRELIPEVTLNRPKKELRQRNEAQQNESLQSEAAGGNQKQQIQKPKAISFPEPFEYHRRQQESLAFRKDAVRETNPYLAPNTQNTPDVPPDTPSAGQTVPAVNTPQDIPSDVQPGPSSNTPLDLPSDPSSGQTANVQMELFDGKLLSKEARIRHRIIGQVFDTYWLVQMDDKLYIIDQHAAHEKVLYERIAARVKNQEVSSQLVSPPIILSLNMQEQQRLEAYGTVFKRLGFDISSFGGKEYSISAVPENLFGLTSESFFLEILDHLEEYPTAENVEAVTNRMATMACKAAVKGNHQMSAVEAEALIDELLTLENPYHCPHGRPTIISMSKYELEKKFKRIV